MHFDSPLRRGEMAEVIYRLRTGVQKPSQTFEQMAERSAPGGSTTPIEGVSDACDTGWACKDATHKAFRQADCTWKMESTCAFGCVAGKCRETDCQQADCENFCADGIRYFNGRCVGVGCRYISSKCQYGCDGDNCRSTSVPVTDTDSCENMTCPDYCSSDVRYFNGRCEDGTCEYSTQLCSEDCENGKCVSASVGPCAGVTCNDYCDGNTRKYNGQCSEGNCSYMSEVCGFGCSGGQCNQDDCQGITCDDYCDGINAYSDGYCHDGQCQYETIASCPYECDGTICLEYHCQWSWPQKIINKNTAVVVWPCTSARPYCQMGTTLCCKKDGPGQGYPYYDCQNMETGELQDGGEQDSDEDGMPDDWERENGLDETTWDPDQDPDGDGFTNLDEYEGGTDPQDPMSHPFSDDLDMDGMSDAWEIENGLDETTWDADQDPDLDGYTNLEEYESSTDPQDPMSIPS